MYISVCVLNTMALFALESVCTCTSMHSGTHAISPRSVKLDACRFLGTGYRFNQEASSAWLAGLEESLTSVFLEFLHLIIILSD